SEQCGVSSTCTGAVSGLAPDGTYEFALRGETRGALVVTRTGAVSGLAPGGTYEFALRGETRPAPSALPAPGAASPNTVAVRFRSDYFSPANGNVTAYTLVVTEDPSAAVGGVGAAPARMPSWRDVQRLPVWPPYQGPLHSTRDDFWRMCWESGARGIVMLTRCVEKGREKCDRYWPYDTRPVYYGDIAVTALNESRYPDWTVTELMLSRGSEQRVVKHFHFTTWPDFGVPEPPETLARFVRAFRERCPPDARPVVVHCSAGVGRSGTFITLDTALQQLARGADVLDVFGMVHAMRRERVWMVQTEQQYICIHQCLVAVLEGQDLAPPPHHNHHLNPAFEGDAPCSNVCRAAGAGEARGAGGAAGRYRRDRLIYVLVV
ncbi:Receptor protein-tyrosine phosphatase 10d, partial [Operophtera brumata]